MAGRCSRCFSGVARLIAELAISALGSLRDHPPQEAHDDMQPGTPPRISDSSTDLTSFTQRGREQEHGTPAANKTLQAPCDDSLTDDMLFICWRTDEGSWSLQPDGVIKDTDGKAMLKFGFEDYFYDFTSMIRKNVSKQTQRAIRLSWLQLGPVISCRRLTAGYEGADVCIRYRQDGQSSSPSVAVLPVPTWFLSVDPYMGEATIRTWKSPVLLLPPTIPTMLALLDDLNQILPHPASCRLIGFARDAEVIWLSLSFDLKLYEDLLQARVELIFICHDEMLNPEPVHVRHELAQRLERFFDRQRLDSSSGHADVMLPFGDKLPAHISGDIVKAAITLAKHVANVGVGENQMAHGFTIVVGSGEQLLDRDDEGYPKFGETTAAHNVFCEVDISVEGLLHDMKNLRFVLSQFAQDGCIIIDGLSGHFCAGNYLVVDMRRGSNAGGARHRSASAVAQQAGTCFVIKCSEEMSMLGKAVFDIFLGREEHLKYDADLTQQQ
eukprot:TRINITY_DN9950_c0_g1_i3.p1 TRINITY_DN9950_c0_g1~~TRINITY_DN9950_c0_g1_i3.p1  ORF type:complete len:496 (-),score=53.14 TRINITY_DN9950_c0_g1_i3:15-1502(-)